MSSSQPSSARTGSPGSRDAISAPTARAARTRLIAARIRLAEPGRSTRSNGSAVSSSRSAARRPASSTSTAGSLRRALAAARRRRPEHPADLGRARRDREAGIGQGPRHGTEQGPVTVDELGLDLAPGHRLVAARPLTGHLVVGDLDEDATVGRQQLVHHPPGDQRGHRDQRVAAGHGPDQRRERGRWRAAATERAVHLQPLAVRHRELEVPPVVGSSRTTAQRGPRGAERQRLGVEVAGRQHHLGRGRGGDDARDTDEVGQRLPGLGVELRLDLQLGGHRPRLRQRVRGARRR